ncbi:MAG: N-acetylneuraminate synthase family protein [Candidatus Eremiobacteraeota bacterium]|nr:N-acetylneuraminate synthase family protein [Candidatus Eremiobacteraeota bacterium]
MKSHGFSIAGRPIGECYPPFIIAEVGINHNGDIATALEMIHVAKTAGADAVKFQTFKAAELVGDRQQQFTYRSQGREVTESMREMFERNELPEHAWDYIKERCEKENILFFSTPQNRSDLDLLLAIGVPAIKVGSDDFVNLPLIRSYAQTGLPLILSCGMSNLAEVYTSLETVGGFDGYPVALLLCTSQYPTPPSDVHLRKLTTLRGAFPHLTLGFSDHTESTTAASLAVALGARIFEKHFTLDRESAGPDHWFSETPESLATWVASIRTSYAMLGNETVRPTEVERRQIGEFRRVVVAAKAIAAGEPFNDENLMMRRDPSGSIGPALYDLLLGLTAKRPFTAGEAIEL